MQPRIPVEILTLETQILLPRLRVGHLPLVLGKDWGAVDVGVRPRFPHRIAPGLVTRLPDALSLGVGQLFRQSDRVSMEVIDLAKLGLPCSPRGLGVSGQAGANTPGQAALQPFIYPGFREAARQPTVYGSFRGAAL